MSIIHQNTHPLLKNAKRSAYIHAPEMSPDAAYDIRKGYWMEGSVPLADFSDRRRRPSSKKADIETGEDQKGE